MDSTKTVDSVDGNKTSNSAQTNKVKLIVKASNQQYQDEIIECENNWTIQTLKEHLSKVYPSKPNIAEQKLIYAGKLLTDKLILHEILRSYDDVENTNHIFHLVYTPKMSQQNQRLSQSSKNQPQSAAPQIQQPQPVQSSDGLRYRNSVNNSASLNQPNIPILQQASNFAATICPPTGPFNFPAGYSNNAINANNNIVVQQMAMQSWMHQAYIQYMNQYMNLISSGIRPENFFTQNHMLTGSLSTGNNNFGIPQMPSLLSQPVPQNLINNQGHQGSNESTPHLPNPVEGAVGQQNQAPQIEQPAGAQEAAVAPRFPQIVQDEQQHENRDWLDNFYSFSRLLLLLTLVYFYSSPLRCLIVLVIGIGFYINHIGNFRLHHQQNRNINDNNNNNNAPRPQPAPPADNEEGNNADTPNNNDNENTPTVPNSSSDNNLIIPEAEGPNALAFLRTFVVTFFTSLLPEAPAAL